jgi:hypothetical protein
LWNQLIANSGHSLDGKDDDDEAEPYPNPEYLPPPRVKESESGKSKRSKTGTGRRNGGGSALEGRQATPDGRYLVTPTHQDSTGIAGSGDQDSHSPTMLFHELVDADQKTGWGDAVMSSNCATDYDAEVQRLQNEMLANAAAGQSFVDPPGVMEQIIAGRRAGRDRV